LFSAEIETNSQIFGLACMEIVVKRQKAGEHKGHSTAIQTLFKPWIRLGF